MAIAAAAVLAAGAGCVGVGSSIGMSYDEAELKKSVAFETRCPEANIKVREAMEAGIGHSKFVLEVCGQEQRWVRMGTSYFAEGKAPAYVPGTTTGTLQPGPAPGAPPTREVAPPPPPAPPTPPPAEGAVSRAEYAQLLQRISDLELRAAGKKTNSQLIDELNNNQDNAWQLRLNAAKQLGERKALEARPALEAIVASDTASGQLKKSAQAALQQITAGAP